MSDIKGDLRTAYDFYLSALVDLVSPTIYSGMTSIWNNAIHKHKKLLKNGNLNYSVYIIFQKELQAIKVWNQEIIDNEHKRLIQDIEQYNCNERSLEFILEALFRVYANILGIVAIKKGIDIHLKIPDFKTFIHNCYKNLASLVFKNPTIFEESNLQLSEIESTIAEAISLSVQRLIPIHSLLSSYLTESHVFPDDTSSSILVDSEKTPSSILVDSVDDKKQEIKSTHREVEVDVDSDDSKNEDDTFKEHTITAPSHTITAPGNSNPTVEIVRDLPKLHEISPMSPSNFPKLETVKGETIEDLKLNELDDDEEPDTNLTNKLQGILDKNEDLFF